MATKDRKSFLARVQQGLQKTVAHYATDDGETKTLLARLVDFGHLSREEAAKMLADIKVKLDENRQELDRRVDESVKIATAKLRVSSRGELEELATRLSQLEARADAIILEQK